MRISRLVVVLLAFATVLQAADPRVAGKWSPVKRWPFVACHASLLPNGKIVGWARKEGVTMLDTWIGDPEGSTFKKVLNPYVQPFCGGQTLLPDGILLTAGGHDKWDGWGAIQSTLFDYRTNRWTKSADMNAGRWYPTTSPLSNGDVVVLSGSMPPASRPEGSNGINPLPQVWSNGHWRDLTGAIDENLPLYPRIVLAPDGRIFMAGPAAESEWLDTSGTGKWTPGPTSSVPMRDYGSVVMYEPGKVLTVGGARPPVKSAEIVDLNEAKPEWKATGSMSIARRQMNATILADGTVLATGGSYGPGFSDDDKPVYIAELWDPATGKWTTMAKASVIRTYHSVSLLLPDARLLNAGGGLPPWGIPSPPVLPGAPPGTSYDPPGRYQNNAQIYSPPYLFKGARPIIRKAPKSVVYGQTFAVETGVARVSAVTWIRLGAVTHAFDMSQRFMRLDFKREGNSLMVTAPDQAAISPPGPYMLFLLNSKGVPSVAKIVMIK